MTSCDRLSLCLLQQDQLSLHLLLADVQQSVYADVFVATMQVDIASQRLGAVDGDPIK